MTIGIGSKVWVFDINRRKYPPAEPGRLWASGGPIWIEHWCETEIIGETPRCWILKRHDETVPKKGADPRKVLFSYEDVKRAAWINDNTYGISEAVIQFARTKSGAAEPALRQIAALIDYKEKA